MDLRRVGGGIWGQVGGRKEKEENDVNIFLFQKLKILFKKVLIYITKLFVLKI